MAFDAGFVAATVWECGRMLTGARVEKVFQPDKDVVILALHCAASVGGDSVRLLIDVGSASPRVHLTSVQPENPKAPPMFCMLLRKRLNGAKILSVTQLGFERVIEIKMEARDEMGFTSDAYLIAEIMGKCSNLILLDADRKVSSALKIVDFTTSRVRQVLPGMTYEAPPAQEGKISPFDVTEAIWEERIGTLLCDPTHEPPAKLLVNRFCGLSPLTAREIVSRADPDDPKGLYHSFVRLCEDIRENRFTPVLLAKEDGTPMEYSWFPIAQYGSEIKKEICPDFGTLCDRFFGEKSRKERVRQRASDILRLLVNADSRLTKKITQQKQDLLQCEKKEELKQMGDLITSNLYQLKRGMTSAVLTDYADPDLRQLTVTLDIRMTPSQNAQWYYKKYAKAKSAEVALTHQIELAEAELAYLSTVFDALTHAETEADLDEIREELYESGFASRMKGYAGRKKTQPHPMTFVTSGGYRVLCGKNNVQNDHITHHMAGKNDWWFHVKGLPGSHVVLLCDGEEPPERDFTEAATIAAYYSKAEGGQNVAVDYTQVRYLKKPPASHPGYVTFSHNYTAYVTPDEKLVQSLRQGGGKIIQ